MANTEKGEVGFEHEGQSYTLVLSTNALIKLEELFSTKDQIFGIREIEAEVKKGSAKHLRAVFWASLQRYHAQVAPTPEEAGDFMDDVGNPAGLALLRLFGIALPDGTDLKELAGPNPLRAQVPTPRKRGGTSTFKSVKSVA